MTDVEKMLEAFATTKPGDEERSKIVIEAFEDPGLKESVKKFVIGYQMLGAAFGHGPIMEALIQGTIIGFNVGRTWED